ncbi:MAG: Hsp70 family protein [Deltaproteobacteria bacterium]|nr:Hsp70 family protein [Deltaproteobacteria bacterium]
MASSTSVALKWSLEQLVKAYMADPALDGVTLIAKKEVPVGTIVNLSIELAPGKLFRCTGKVMRIREDGQKFAADLRFTEIREDLRAWLLKQVEVARQRMAAGGAPLKTGHELRQATSGDALSAASLDVNALDLAGGPVLGIDLGTCNSAACWVKDGKPTMIDLSDPSLGEHGVTTLPSVVAYDDDGRVSVGKPAQDGLTKNARRTVYGAKRFIGRTYDSPAVASMLPRFPYRVVRGNGGKVAIDINGQPVTLTAISAKILGVIKERAESHAGVSFERAIITVPAYYNDNQRDAVVSAGRLAGFTVDRILNEPTAAAIAYGLSYKDPQTILVYDLGGGTFDVSVMSVHQGALTVLATAGDTFLGGEDFDAALLAHVSAEFTKQTKKKLSQNHAALAIVKDACEKAKRRLSSKDKTTVSVREVVLSDRSTARLEVDVTRATFEALIEPLVSRTLKICSAALRAAKLDPAGLSEVLLVGGQTRMPYVIKRVAEHFEKKPRRDLNPDEVVAMGAGMLAALGAGENAKLKDVLAMSIGFAHSGKFQPVLMQNTQVPCFQSVEMKVKKAELATAKLALYQGESEELHQNEALGEVRLDAVKPGTKDPVPLRIDFLLSGDCLLKVRIANMETGEAQSVLLSTRD